MSMHGHGGGHGAAHGTKPAAPANSASPSTPEAGGAAAGGYGLIATVYLLGLFIGALLMGVINPARVVIQNSLGVDDQLGVWMLTIYTLAYAVSIPIMGKLADRHGRKYIYLACVLLFGIGSIICGLSKDFSSFELLLVGRAIQALGGGGIMPVATAEFGTAFPEEKRGMALGLVGGVYGVANVFGASIGSLILDVFGQNEWQYIFYVFVPVCIFILIVGIMKLPNSKDEQVKPIDGIGILVLTLMILSLLYGLKNINFMDLGASMLDISVWPFMVAFLALIPLFVFIEKRAVDPVMNIAYFKDRDIVITLVCSVGTGLIMMAMVFLPQFCENCLFMRSGAGGYFIIIVGLFAGLGSPLSGVFIDKFGAKPVLGFGFIASVIGALYLAFVACTWPNVPNVVISLILLGLGMGFTMGTPLNYMMLQKTDEAESNSALATLSLVRSLGTAVAPAIMVAFIATAGASMQSRLMDAMPTEVEVSPLPYAQELDDELAAMLENPDTAEMMDGLEMPKLMSFTKMEMSMDSMSDDGDFEIDDAVLAQLQSADVTTVVDAAKAMASSMFGQVKPDIIEQATNGIAQGIEGMNGAASDLSAAISKMRGASKELGLGGKLMGTTAEMDAALKDLRGTIAKLQEVKEAVPGMFDEAEENYLAAIDDNAEEIQLVYQSTLNEGFAGMFILVAICSAIGFVLLLFFRDTREKKPEAQGEENVESEQTAVAKAESENKAE